MAATGAGSPGRLVQYVVVRSDLVHKLSWPLGAVITQACHAATAAIHLHYGDPDTQRYLAELDSMHKVVLAVGCRRSCPLRPVREPHAGRCGPQAVDRTTGERPHLLGSEAVSEGDSPAAAAQVQTLQMKAF
ncbi:putative peptidyl-tRNA hydrolase PTRHD1 isoform X1 [Pungitius pungitius]|uniref:putative peptidyl-tRNA hydrolase PTRHD1 isoform X1 n=1 Tax=Pungitius pungitius TaxID=134920 RepID=UPI0018875333|nr:putative peptidyl-tRNA hydrolase PTRHD1 isoform X1 [Pungitius pungitius]